MALTPPLRMETSGVGKLIYPEEFLKANDTGFYSYGPKLGRILKVLKPILGCLGIKIDLIIYHYGPKTNRRIRYIDKASFKLWMESYYIDPAELKASAKGTLNSKSINQILEKVKGTVVIPKKLLTKLQSGTFFGSFEESKMILSNNKWCVVQFFKRETISRLITKEGIHVYGVQPTEQGLQKKIYFYNPEQDRLEDETTFMSSPFRINNTPLDKAVYGKIRGIADLRSTSWSKENPHAIYAIEKQKDGSCKRVGCYGYFPQAAHVELLQPFLKGKLLDVLKLNSGSEQIFLQLKMVVSPPQSAPSSLSAPPSTPSSSFQGIPGTERAAHSIPLIETLN